MKKQIVKLKINHEIRKINKENDLKTKKLISLTSLISFLPNFKKVFSINLSESSEPHSC